MVIGNIAMDRISTLDNPGWAIDIQLEERYLDDMVFRHCGTIVQNNIREEQGATTLTR